MSDGIGDEVPQGMFEPRGVDGDRTGLAVDFDGGAEADEMAQGVVNDRGDSRFHRVVAQVLGVDPGCDQDVVDHPSQIPGFLEDRRQALLEKVRIRVRQ